MLRVWRALGYSLAGLRSAYTQEPAFRQELVLAVVLIPAAFLLPLARLEQVLLAFSVLVVLIVELVNSAIEAVVDRISTDHHALAKRAKDLGSAAVFVSLVGCLLVWVVALVGIWR